MLEHVFVYGTLKRGQVRERCWPLPASAIQPAWTFGWLYDLGPYPAMIEGNQPVLGEIWSFQASELPDVLGVLDVIEGTNQPGEPDEYTRTMVSVFAFKTTGGETETAGEMHQASTYLYARRSKLTEDNRVTKKAHVEGREMLVWP